MPDENQKTTAINPSTKKTTTKAKRSPKTVSPEVEAIRAECRAKIKALHGVKQSNKILQTIVVKRLPQMTQEHRQALFEELAKTCTPPLYAAAE